MNRALYSSVCCAGLSHHEADIPTLESFRFEDERALLGEAREWFKGVMLLQTCNRVEILVQGDAGTLDAFLKEKGRTAYWIREGTDALHHLLSLAAGMDSMVVGEDQILGQLRGSLATSQEEGACSPLIEQCITKAVHVGVEVRKRTKINNGAVSIGSAAVQLAEELLGSLEGKHILVVGSGEMGRLVTQALAAKHLTAIYVTNRTYDRAVALAAEIGGKAVNLDELYHYIALSDVVISCTAAPHPVIHCDPLCDAIKDRHWPLDTHPRPLIIIDIAQPRDVEECVCDIEGVHIFSIDDLRSVSENNMKNRLKEAELARRFVGEELDQFVTLLNRTTANDALAMLHTWAEAIRIRERDRALSRLDGADPGTAEVIDDLSRVIVKKILLDATYSIRASAECGEMLFAEALVRAITQGERLCFHKED
jgi:glutamyl-tRNA reductase